MDKIREDFNNWIDSLDFKQLDDLCEQSAWSAWQASRQALVVELPATCFRTLVFEIEGSSEVGMEHDEYYEVDDILSALNDAGIKYK